MEACGYATRSLLNAFSKLSSNEKYPFSEIGHLDKRKLIRSLRQLKFPCQLDITDEEEEWIDSYLSDDFHTCAFSFGRYCVLVSDIKFSLDKKRNSKLNFKHVCEKYSCFKISNCQNQVFLGGSCNPSTWRQDIAIPYFESHNISFYNPIVPEWTQDLIEIEQRAKNSAQVLLFVIGKETRGIASVIEAAHLIGCGCPIILVIEPPPKVDHQLLNNIDESEIVDMEESRWLLSHYAYLHQVPVLNEVQAAVQAVAAVIHHQSHLSHTHYQSICQELASVPMTQIRSSYSFTMRKLQRVFNSTDVNHENLLSFDKVIELLNSMRRIPLSDKEMDLIAQKQHPTAEKQAFSFDQFCSLAVEYSFALWPTRPTTTNFLPRILNAAPTCLQGCLCALSINPNGNSTSVYLLGNYSRLDEALRARGVSVEPVNPLSLVEQFNSDKSNKPQRKRVIVIITQKQPDSVIMTKTAYGIANKENLQFAIFMPEQNSEWNSHYTRGLKYLLNDIAELGGACVYRTIEDVFNAIKK